jgi:hypothetical protein
MPIPLSIEQLLGLLEQSNPAFAATLRAQYEETLTAAAEAVADALGCACAARLATIDGRLRAALGPRRPSDTCPPQIADAVGQDPIASAASWKAPETPLPPYSPD